MRSARATTSPTTAVLISHSRIGTSVQLSFELGTLELARSGSKLLMTSLYSYQLADLTSVMTPLVSAPVSGPVYGGAFVVDDKYIYQLISGAGGGLYVYSLADFSNVGNFQVPDALTSLALANGRVYAAADTSLYIFNVENPAQPSVSARLTTISATQLSISGGYLFVTAGETTTIYGLKNPDAPNAVSQLPGGSNFVLSQNTLFFSTTPSIFTMGTFTCAN